MARHSKNNTALGYFTYDEKKKAKYGSIKQRLGKDSMRNFDVCYLCLSKAKNPLACIRGHISCKECITENLVNQRLNLLKQDKLAKKQLDLEKKKAEEVQALEAQKKIESFEKIQNQLSTLKGIEELNQIKESNLKKDKDEFDEEAQNKYQLKRKLGEGYSESALPAFWLPSLTPDIGQKKIEAPKSLKITYCTAEEQHQITLKSLIPVKFQFNKIASTSKKEKESENETQPECPACLKILTNAMTPILMVQCGHVLCKKCTEQFVKEVQKCYCCDLPCKGKADLVELKHDGTGYAAGGGKVEVKKFRIGFQ